MLKLDWTKPQKNRFDAVICLLTLLCFALPSLAFESTMPTTNRLGMEWTLSLAGLSAESTDHNAQLMRLGAEFKFKYNLNTVLDLDLQPSLRFDTGSSQSIAGEAPTPSQMRILQAAALFHPWTNLQLMLGALDQSQLHSSIVAGPQAFPEIRMQWQAINGYGWASGPLLGSAVPTSTQLASQTGEKEAFPQLNTTGIFANFFASSHYKSVNRVNYFQYSGIPRAVMTQSVLQGNSGSNLPISDVNTALLYEFHGYELTSETQLPLFKGLDGIILGSYVQNQGAPEGYNSGAIFGAGGLYNINSNLALSAVGQYFRIEPDAAVAAYSSNQQFFTNRVGFTSSVNVEFKKSKFRIGAAYTEAGLIYESESQRKEKLLMLRLETLNASL